MFHFQTWTARLAVDVVVSGEGEKSQQQWRPTGYRENTELEDFTGRIHCVDAVREEGHKSQQQWRPIGSRENKDLGDFTGITATLYIWWQDGEASD